MCLIVNRQMTRNFLRCKSLTVLRYKVVKVYRDNSDVTSPYQEEFKWKKGWNKPDNKLDVDPKSEGASITEGAIHVFCTKEEAELEKKDWRAEDIPIHEDQFKVIEVKCNRKDLIAVGKFYNGFSITPIKTEVYKRVYLAKLPKYVPVEEEEEDFV